MEMQDQALRKESKQILIDLGKSLEDVYPIDTTPNGNLMIYSRSSTKLSIVARLDSTAPISA